MAHRADSLPCKRSVDKVGNHTRCRDEGKTKNNINSNIRPHGDQERDGITILGGIGKMDVEPDCEFCSHRRRVWCVDDALQNNSHIVLRQVDLL